uniref:Cyclic nucleotide-binding domain-containing protein n=1 Tax=Globisporangium ultimum (strain ATCC 200006 / CBS 805.95 / DAOM BR144) TaxID=431595 RepID=K3WX61_GLOUD
MPRRKVNAHGANGRKIVDDVAEQGVEADEDIRRVSLASQLEALAQQGAFAQAVKSGRAEVAACRAILTKPQGKRTLDDIHMLKSLLASSKLLDFFANLDAFEIVRFDEVLAADPAQADPFLHLAKLNPGDTFGERALLTDLDQRAASAVVASDSVELVFITRAVFKELLKESQEADAGANTLEITKRFRSNKDIIRNIFMRQSNQRSEKDLKFAVEYLKSVKFFSRFSFEVRKQLCKAMRLISAVTNTVLFEEGQVGKHFYIIFSGSVEVTVRSKDRFGETSENVVSRLGEGECFGELALSESDGIRRATVMCVDYCELLVLSRDQYEPLIKKYQNEYHAQYAHLLRKNAYFIGSEWDDNTIEGMCSVMTEKYFPFRGEICKQGSRASEMFIVTRGECVMIHEGKHPITSKFNDIHVRDYSVYAESPVKLLVLSRFDIFHLMSPEARESLQRSAAGYIRESIESRALKSVAWEKYRKKFLEDFMASKQKNGIGSDRGPSNLLKSTSTPVLRIERTVKQVVEPGCLVLEHRRAKYSFDEQLAGRTPEHASPSVKQPSISKLPKPNVLEKVVDWDILSEDRPRRHSDAGMNPVKEDDDGMETSAPESPPKPKVSRIHSLNDSFLTPELQLAVDNLKKLSVDGDTNVKVQEPQVSSNGKKEVSPAERRKSIVSAQNPLRLARSRTLASLNPTDGALPPSYHDKPLHDASIASCYNDRQKSVQAAARIEKAASDNTMLAIKMPTATSATAIWNPVHGVCQPFSLLGFMQETNCRNPSPTASRLRSHKSADSRKAGTTTSNHSTSGTNYTILQGEKIISAFRVFGKFRDLNETLLIFRHICGLEKVPPPEKDTTRFAIYKEDEVTMVLENFFSTESTESDTSPASAAPPTAYQFRAGDMVHGNGQRFACVSVLLQVPPKVIENVTVHVYQCFPTPQSAVRFAKQMVASTLTATSLYIVPLFDWIPLADLERFDAKNSDLEQALEVVMNSGYASYRSTWKARKDAIKKARAHLGHHHQTKPKSS